MRTQAIVLLRFVATGCIAFSLPLAGGCVGPMRTPDVPSLAGRRAGVGGAIRFQTVGGAIDAPAADPQTLSLEAALRQAVTTDPAIQIALARVRGAEADARQARLLPNPILSFTIRPRFGPESALITPAISEDLLGVLLRPRRASAADHRLRAAATDALAAVLDVVSQVQRQYADVQAAEAQLTVLGERRKTLDRLLKLADARLTAGEGSRLDLTTVQAQQETLHAQIATTRIDLNEQRLALARLIGRPRGNIPWRLEPWSAPPSVGTDQRLWIASALRYRPEIQSGIWELAALGDDVALARFAIWDGTLVGVDAERDVYWSVGPSFSIPLPIFDMGQAKRRKAIAAVIEGRHKLTQSRRAVVEEVRKAHDTYNATQLLLIRAKTRLLPLQESRQRLAEASYRAGETDLTTLLLAEEELQNARATLVDLEQKTTQAFIRLERAVGGAGIMERLELRDSASDFPPDNLPATGAPMKGLPPEPLTP